MMGKQVFVFLSLPGETAEKEPGVGGGAGQSAKKGNKSRNVELEPVHFGLQNHTTGCQYSLYRSQDVREKFFPLLKKKKKFFSI